MIPIDVVSYRIGMRISILFALVVGMVSVALFHSLTVCCVEFTLLSVWFYRLTNKEINYIENVY